MFSFKLFSCADGITPNSGLTGPNNTYIYIYVCVCVCVCVCVVGQQSFISAYLIK